MTVALKELTVKDIRRWGPCKDPVEEGYCIEEWRGSILDIINSRRVSVNDRIWCAISYLDDKQRRLFAVYCARQALALVDNPDPRSLAAVDVAERFANSEATQQELDAAWDAAWAAAWDAARDAAWAAARDAAWAAAWDAARAAAWAAARDAARAAAWDAARDAARAAARAAAWAAARDAARAAAWAAARDAARKKQLAYLRRMLKTK